MGFYVGIIDKTGKCYSLGEVVSHEVIAEKFGLKRDKVIRMFGLKDDTPHAEPGFVKWELSPKKELDFLSAIDRTHWKFKLEEHETPSWWSDGMEKKCWEHVIGWFASADGKRFVRNFSEFKKLNRENEKLAKMSGEQIIWRTKLLPEHRDLIIEYYSFDNPKRHWDQVRTSVWASDWDSVSASIDGTIWAAIRDSVWKEVKASLLSSIEPSARASVWDSVRATFWDSIRDSTDRYPLELPKRIFKEGYLHDLIREKDGNYFIYIWGKKGTLLDKIEWEPQAEKKR
jgi:hypothetical protein